ncbi:MAG: division plane positioning ATPase MipZ [Planctomycetota bacterium]
MNFIQTHARSKSPATVESASAQAEALRAEIAALEAEQFSTTASRRLDEALLRLDQAVGKRRRRESTASTVPASHLNSVAPGKPRADSEIESLETAVPPIAESSVPPSDPAPASPVPESPSETPSPVPVLELDDSVVRTSSLWIESEGQTHRVEPAHRVAAPALRDLPPARRHRQPDASGPVAPESPLEDVVTESTTIEALFGTPIDVLMVSGTMKVNVTERDEMPTEEAPSDAAATNRIEAQEPDGSAEPEPSIQADPDGHQPASPESAITDEVMTESIAAEPDDELEASSTGSSETPPTPQVQKAVASSQIDVSAPAPFQAAWQVDQFPLPTAVEELFLTNDLSRHLADRLSTAHQGGLRSIAITSLLPGEGRSTVAMGLALSIAAAGLRVALVDADALTGGLADSFQLDLDNGWLDAMRTSMPLSEIAVTSEADQVTLLPLIQRSDEMPDPAEVRTVVQKTKADFDMILVDCPASCTRSAALCDTALIVRDVQRSASTEVETYALTLRRAGLHGVGIVENYCRRA